MPTKQTVKITAKKTGEVFDPGTELFSWMAHDYHPHHRGWLWFVIFCLVFFGSAAWAFLSGDWIMASTLFIAVAVYFWIHRNGNEEHTVRVYEKGIQVDRMYFPMERFTGFWFCYDPSVSVINLEMGGGKRTLKLQMGQILPDDFREQFARISLPELMDKKENLIDLWIRALKL